MLEMCKIVSSSHEDWLVTKVRLQVTTVKIPFVYCMNWMKFRMVIFHSSEESIVHVIKLNEMSLSMCDNV